MRILLVEAAARDWGVPASEIKAEMGQLTHASGKLATYGEMARKTEGLTLPADIPLKPRGEWTQIGNAGLKRFDSKPKTNGTLPYTIDVQLPNMATAVMIHPPKFGATVKSFDASKAAGKDPVEFRLALLKDHPRHAAVLKLAADKAGWGAAPAQGRFRGVAVAESFSSVVAQVVEISLPSAGSVKVEKVVCAVDCGTAINPDQIVAQMQGGIGFGLSSILGEEITLTNGTVDQENYDTYTPLRIDQMPAVEVHIVPSEAAPTGVGEPGVPPIGPALANAVYQATKKRVRTLPLAKGLTA